jgi:hypothetical protein
VTVEGQCKDQEIRMFIVVPYLLGFAFPSVGQVANYRVTRLSVET